MGNIRDDLASSLAKSLNKTFKDRNRIAFFLDGTEETQTDVPDWISTGSTLLDLAISNRAHGGVPVGRIIEITGLESTGKSLVAAQALATVQKRGGVAVYIDTENALSMEFLSAIGIDVKNMVYAPLDTIEDIFSAIEAIIENVRKTDNDRLVAIVVDSIAGASTKAEMESDYDKDGYATGKAIIISKALRKITNLIGREKIALILTNQLRVRLNAMFGDPYTTSGGKAIGFHSSVRIRLKNKGQIKRKSGTREETIGITVYATVVKNRVGPPFRTGEFDVYFDRGIDDTNGWLKILKDLRIVKPKESEKKEKEGKTIKKTVKKEEGKKRKPTSWYTIVNEKKEEVHFQSKEWPTMLEDETFKEYVYQLICNSVIMKYKVNPDKVVVTKGVEGEESGD